MDLTNYLFKTQDKFRKRNFWFTGDRLYCQILIPILKFITLCLFIVIKVVQREKENEKLLILKRFHRNLTKSESLRDRNINLKIRISINLGEVVAGIVGKKRE